MGEVDEAVVDEKLRARILACAIAAGALDDEALTNANALSLFAGRELVPTSAQMKLAFGGLKPMATQPMMSASALLVVQTGVTDGGGSAGGGGDGTGGSSASDGGGGYCGDPFDQPTPAEACCEPSPVVPSVQSACGRSWLHYRSGTPPQLGHIGWEAAVATTISSGIANPAAAANGTTRAVPMSLYRLQRSTDRSVPLAAGEVAYKLSWCFALKPGEGAAEVLLRVGHGSLDASGSLCGGDCEAPAEEAGAPAAEEAPAEMPAFDGIAAEPKTKMYASMSDRATKTRFNVPDDRGSKVRVNEDEPRRTKGVLVARGRRNAAELRAGRMQGRLVPVEDPGAGR